MTPLERLKELLDGLGVSHHDDDGYTMWGKHPTLRNAYQFRAYEVPDSDDEVHLYVSVSPEDAVRVMSELNPKEGK